MIKSQTKGRSIHEVTIKQIGTFNEQEYIIVGGTIETAPAKAMQIAKKDKSPWSSRKPVKLRVEKVEFIGTIDN